MLVNIAQNDPSKLQQKCSLGILEIGRDAHSTQVLF